jgi:large subunit ribosomal protein L21
MYAVVSSGGKQYCISPGDILQVEKLHKALNEKVEIDQVLLISEDDDLQVGNPFIKGAKVVCTLVEERKGKKVIVFKMKRRKGYRRKIGHRQLYNFLKVEDIVAGKPAAKAKAKPDTKREIEPKPRVRAKAKPKAASKPKPKAKPKTKAEAKAKDKPRAVAKPEPKAKPKAKKAPESRAKTKTQSKPSTRTKKKATARSSKAKEQVNGS